MKKISKKNKIYFGQDPNDKKFAKKQNTHEKNSLPQKHNSLDDAPSFSKEGVYKIFKKTAHPLRLDDILRRLDVSRRSKKELLFLLQELTEEGKLIKQRGASYALCENLSNIIGRLSIQRSGAGFVTPQLPHTPHMSHRAQSNHEQNTKNKITNQKDIYIPAHALSDAWNGDLVEVSLLPSSKPNFSHNATTQRSVKHEGRINKILERAQTSLSLCIESEAKKQDYRHFKNAHYAVQNNVQYAFIARPTDSRFSFRVLLPLPSPEEFDTWEEFDSSEKFDYSEEFESWEQKTHTNTTCNEQISERENSTNKANSKRKKTSHKTHYFLKTGDLVIANLAVNTTEFNSDTPDTTTFDIVAHNTKNLTHTSIPRPVSHDLYLGKVIKKLGAVDRVSVQEEVTKHNHTIPTHFPDDVIEEAKQIANTQGFFYTQEDEEHFKIPLLHKDANNREAKYNKDQKTSLDPQDIDLRNLALVTIDGADSKDFDDAIYVEKQNNNFRLLVAIADVSRYVEPFSKIDLEAKARANSYYFPSSVEPMIPPILSNGLCSLCPDEEHKIMFADMLFDEKGMRIQSNFGQGVMRSKARLTYEGVQDFYDYHFLQMEEKLPCSNQKKIQETKFISYKNIITKNLDNMLLEAHTLAKILINNRQVQGALHLEIPEPKCVTKNNAIVKLATRPHLFTHELIEAFMIHANEAVADFLHKKKAPCLYRIHPAPAPERLDALNLALQTSSCAQFLPILSPEKMGINNWLSTLLDNQNQDKIQSQNEGSSYLTHQLILRSMMQARYSPYLDEHFGLASACYCHFTSPIRRYSDLIVHRSLKKCLGITSSNEKSIQNILSEDSLISIADKCNEQERVAQNAEREIFRRLACILLESDVNKEFDAIISGVTPFGLFAQMKENMAEGMIRMENLSADYFIYDEQSQSLYGQKTKIRYHLGDSIKVVLQSVDLSRLEINLALSSDIKYIQNTKIIPRNSKQAIASHSSHSFITCKTSKASKTKKSISQKETLNKTVQNQKVISFFQEETLQIKPKYPKKPKQNKSHKKRKKDHKKKLQNELDEI